MALFALFVAVPLIEIALFIQIGGLIGLWPTLAVVLVTAALGTFLVRQQGTRAIAALRQSLNELRDPSKALADGAMILLAGALLLTPGFFTDAVGFALLVPGVRRALFDYLRQRIKVQRFEMGGAHRPAPHGGDDVIDGEFHETSASSANNPGNSGWTRH